MLGGLLFLGVLGTGIGYVVWFWLLDRISLIRLGTALFVVPVTGVLAGVVTGDRLLPVELPGIAAVLVGLATVPVGGASPASVERSARPTA